MLTPPLFLLPKQHLPVYSHLLLDPIHTPSRPALPSPDTSDRTGRSRIVRWCLVPQSELKQQRCQLTRIRTHYASFYLFFGNFAYLTRDAYLTRVKKRLFFPLFQCTFFLSKYGTYNAKLYRGSGGHFWGRIRGGGI